MEMPNRIFHGLYCIVLKRALTDAGAKKMAAEQVEDEIADHMP